MANGVFAEAIAREGSQTNSPDYFGFRAEESGQFPRNTTLTEAGQRGGLNRPRSRKAKKKGRRP